MLVTSQWIRYIVNGTLDIRKSQFGQRLFPELLRCLLSFRRVDNRRFSALGEDQQYYPIQKGKGEKGKLSGGHLPDYLLERQELTMGLLSMIDSGIRDHAGADRRTVAHHL